MILQGYFRLTKKIRLFLKFHPNYKNKTRRNQSRPLINELRYKFKKSIPVLTPKLPPPYHHPHRITDTNKAPPTLENCYSHRKFLSKFLLKCLCILRSTTELAIDFHGRSITATKICIWISLFFFLFFLVRCWCNLSFPKCDDINCIVTVKKKCWNLHLQEIGPNKVLRLVLLLSQSMKI